MTSRDLLVGLFLAAPYLPHVFCKLLEALR